MLHLINKYKFALIAASIALVGALDTPAHALPMPEDTTVALVLIAADRCESINLTDDAVVVARTYVETVTEQQKAAVVRELIRVNRILDGNEKNGCNAVKGLIPAWVK